MRRRRNRTPMAAIDQINITPLLDLTFLLLIAFMITMPLMEYGTNVSPPEMDGEALPEENFITVEVDKEGKYFLDRQEISAEDLAARLRELSAQNPQPDLLVRGDNEQEYGGVLELLRLARSCGFRNASLVTQAEGN
ncbi:MAG: biopolymer transporter ExbD [Lentisphaerae bacterium]|nr:biopolymer transporter ExbD [Lentisphaerota bacterium]